MNLQQQAAADGVLGLVLWFTRRCRLLESVDPPFVSGTQSMVQLTALCT
jgi:hypothetical protein